MQSPKMADTEKRTIVEEGTHLKGSLVSSCPVVVNGRLDGEMIGPSLRVNGTGSVHGKAKVDQIMSEGELSGEFEADLMQLSGVVQDETIVRAKSLEVKLCAPNDPRQVVFGTCALEVGEMPDKEAAIRASRNDAPEAAAQSPAEPSVLAAELSESMARSADPMSQVAPLDLLEGTLAVAEGRPTSKRKSGAPARRP